MLEYYSRTSCSPRGTPMCFIMKLALITCLFGALYSCGSESGMSSGGEGLVTVGESFTNVSTIESLVASPSGTSRLIQIGRDYSGTFEIVSPLLNLDPSGGEPYPYSLSGRLLTCSVIAENSSNLVDGMTEQDVVDLMGHPLNIEGGLGSESRIYDYGRVNSLRTLPSVRFYYDSESLTYRTKPRTIYDPLPVPNSCMYTDSIDFSVNFARQSPPTCSQLQERLRIYPFVSMPEDYLLRYIGRPSRLSIAGTFTDFIYYTYDYTYELLLGTRWIEKNGTVTFSYNYSSGRANNSFSEASALLSYSSDPNIKCN